MTWLIVLTIAITAIVCYLASRHNPTW